VGGINKNNKYLRAEDVFCSLVVLYGGLGICKLYF
jgi:hypothetical protein